jgi:muconolactone delta-isomerase
MEYLVIMTTHIPEGTPEEDVQEIRKREAARSRELAAQGHLLRLWRPPLQPAEWHTLGLGTADSMIEWRYFDLEATIYGEALTPKDGRVLVPQGRGLGIDPDPDVIHAFLKA